MKQHPEGTDRCSDGTIDRVVAQLVGSLTKHYTTLEKNNTATQRIIAEERRQFQSTLDKGEKKFMQLLAQQQ